MNIVHILPGDDALSAQHGRVDKAALNILLDHPRVEADGGVKIVYAAVNGLAGPALPKLRQEIFEVLKKYIQIDSEQDVEFNIANKDNTSIMEMSVSLEKKDESEDNKS